MTKNKFLSLEFIIDDYTYWWTSDHKDGKPWYFTKIPLSFFGDKVLHASLMDLVANADYSEIIQTEDDSFYFYETEAHPEFHIGDFTEETLTWNEMAQFVADKVSLEAAGQFFHNNSIKKKDNCKYSFADINYLVTAFLPDQVFAILGEDHSSENPNWISFSVKSREEFREVIREFNVCAVKNARNEWVEV